MLFPGVQISPKFQIFAPCSGGSPWSILINQREFCGFFMPVIQFFKRKRGQIWRTKKMFVMELFKFETFLDIETFLKGGAMSNNKSLRSFIKITLGFERLQNIFEWWTSFGVFLCILIIFIFFKKMCVFEWMFVAVVSLLHAALHRVDACCAAPGTFKHREGGYDAGATGRNSVPRSFFSKQLFWTSPQEVLRGVGGLETGLFWT